MELVQADTAQVLASYDHYNWKRYAAVTRNHYGKGTATYLGCWISDEMLREILCDVVKEAGLWGKEQETAFPVIIRKGINDLGREVIFYLNYSPETQQVPYAGAEAADLLTEAAVEDGERLEIGSWDLRILER